MNEAIQKLIEAIKADYARMNDGSEIRQRMTEEFNEKISVQVGRKYIKIMTDHSVWGFVMKEDDKKFKAGDILKAASWATPARNKARGNIFEDYIVQWTGPLYLK